MPTLDRADQQTMSNAFYDALNKWQKGGTGGGFAPSSGQGSMPGPVTGLGVVAGKVSDAFGMVTGAGKDTAKGLAELSGYLLKGGSTVSGALDIFSRNIESIAGNFSTGLGSFLGKGIGLTSDLVGFVEDGLPAFRELSSVGANFNNSVIEMKSSAAGAGLTLGEFSEVINKNRDILAGLGVGAAQGTKEFANFSKALMQSSLADELMQMGYSTGELNDLMAIRLAGLKLEDIKGKDNQERQLKATVALAEEMDAMAKLTGQSRKEMQDKLREAQRDGQVQAGLELKRRRNVQDIDDKFNSVLTNVTGPMGKLMQDLITAGRPLTDQSLAMAGIASASPELQKAIQDLRHAFDHGSKEEVQAASRRVQMQYAELTKREEFQSLAAQNLEAFKDANANTLRYNKAMDEARKQLEDENKKKGVTTPVSDEDVNKRAFKIMAEEQKNAGDAATNLVNEMNNRLRNVNSALYDGLIKPLVSDKDGVGSQLREFAGYLKKLNVSMNEKGEKTFDPKFANSIQESLKPLVAEIRSLANAYKTGPGPEPVMKDEESKKINKNILDTLNTLKEKVKNSPDEKYTDADRKFIDSLLPTIQGKNAQLLTDELRKLAGNQDVEEYLKKQAEKPGGLEEVSRELEKNQQLREILQKGQSQSEEIKRLLEGTDTDKTKGRYDESLGDKLSKAFDGVKTISTGNVEKIEIQNTKPVNTPSNENLVKEVNPTSRKTGSLGMVGKLIEDFGQGTLAMLHGKEGVITEDQLLSLAKNLKESSINETIQTTGRIIQGFGENAMSLIQDQVGESSDKQFLSMISSIKDSVDQVKVSPDKQFLSMISSIKDSVDQVKVSPDKQFLSMISSMRSMGESTIDTSMKMLKSSDFSTELKSFSQDLKNSINAIQEKVNNLSTTTKEETPIKSNLDNYRSSGKTEATLDDVVNKLEMLNITMGQLISVSETLGNKQVSAIKQSSTNLYERYMP